MRFSARLRRAFACIGPMARYAAGRGAAAKGAYAEARELFAPLLDGDAQAMGVSQEEFSFVLREIASCSLHAGEPLEAEGICQRALSLCARTPYTGHLLALLAVSKAVRGLVDEATSLLIKAEGVQRRMTGPLSDAYRDLCLELAGHFEWLGQFHNATQCLRRYRLPLERPAAPDIRTLLVVLNHQADIAAKDNDLRLVEALLQRQLSFIAEHRNWHHTTFVTWIRLAETRIARLRFDAARSAIDAAENLLRQYPRRVPETGQHSISQLREDILRYQLVSPPRPESFRSSSLTPTQPVA